MFVEVLYNQPNKESNTQTNTQHSNTIKHQHVFDKQTIPFIWHLVLVQGSRTMLYCQLLKQTSTLCCKCKLCIVYCHLFVVLLLFFELVWLFLAFLTFSICLFFAAFLVALFVNFFFAAAVLFRFLASVFLTTTKEYHFKHTATK